MSNEIGGPGLFDRSAALELEPAGESSQTGRPDKREIKGGREERGAELHRPHPSPRTLLDIDFFYSTHCQPSHSFRHLFLKRDRRFLPVINTDLHAYIFSR